MHRSLPSPARSTCRATRYRSSTEPAAQQTAAPPVSSSCAPSSRAGSFQQSGPEHRASGPCLPVGHGHVADGLRRRRLVHDGDAWKTIAQEGGGTFDLGLPKARAEVLVEGYACPAEPAGGTQVRLALGTVDKTLYVFGDRIWRDATPSDPVVFQRIRVSWEQAFGGEGDERNPVGKGRKPIAVDGATVHPLPNVEWPDRLVRSPTMRLRRQASAPSIRCGSHATDAPEAMVNAGSSGATQSFPKTSTHCSSTSPRGPMARGLPARRRTLRHRAHASGHAVIESRLPGLTARAFVRCRAAPEPLDVPMHCDTAWFFPHVERVALVWRGVFPLATTTRPRSPRCCSRSSAWASLASLPTTSRCGSEGSTSGSARCTRCATRTCFRQG